MILELMCFVKRVFMKKKRKDATEMKTARESNPQYIIVPTKSNASVRPADIERVSHSF